MAYKLVGARIRFFFVFFQQKEIYNSICCICNVRKTNEDICLHLCLLLICFFTIEIVYFKKAMREYFKLCVVLMK